MNVKHQKPLKRRAEKDYRLVKTAKVSCFLNGDGEANIIHANGLASFSSYRDRLYSEYNDNEVFDVLLANPPYSVKQFVNTINIKKTKNYDTLLNKYPIIRLYAKEKSEIVMQTVSRSKGGVGHILDGVPNLGGGHIGKNGEIVYNKMCYVKKDCFDNAGNEKILINDILLCKDGALTGKVCYIDSDYEHTESMVNEHVFIIRSNAPNLRQKYLFYSYFQILGKSKLRHTPAVRHKVV